MSYHFTLRKPITLFLSVIIFFSCTRDSKPQPSPDPTTVKGRVQYKVNGELVVIDHQNLLNNQYCVFVKARVGTPEEIEYHFSNEKGPDTALRMTIKADSLQIKSYHLNYDAATTAPFYLSHKGLNASFFSAGDQVDMNITDYKDGLVSGTFSATLTPTPDNPISHEANSIKITEGKIMDVQVIY